VADKRSLLTREDIVCAELSPGKRRLARIAFRIRQDVDVLDREDLDFIATAFEQILEGIEPKRALGIVEKQHQGRANLTASEADRRMKYALAVEQYRRAGMKRDAAVERVADEFGLSFSTIEDHYKRDRSTIVALLDFMRPTAIGVKK